MNIFSFHRIQQISALIFFTALLCLYTPGLCLGNPVEIEIAKISRMTQDTLCLSHLAEIRAENFLKNAIGAISLGNAPKPGQIRQFDKNHLIRLIKASHLVNDAAQIICPDKVYVKRTAQSLDKKFVQDQVLACLEDRFSPRSFEILSMNIRGAETYPEGNLELVPSSRCFIGNNGRISLSMNVLVDNIAQGKISVTGKIAEFETLVCAARYIEKGIVITSQDICLEKKDLMSLRTKGIRNKSDVLGQTLKFPVNKGQILDPGKVVPASLIQKGEMVTLVVSKNNLQILTSGICMEEGFVNQPLVVENIRSGKKIRGILREDTTVEIVY